LSYQFSSDGYIRRSVYAYQQRAATNMLIKPLVVSIIRQRPVMEYDASHLGNMVNRLEETLPPELPA
uniref:hypothetical protein n=1 Tax=Escherichia coli TaxID=562 RepID=UPI000BE81090